MSNTAMKSQILTLLHFARQQELAMVEALSEAERDAQGTPEKWVAKEYLANILCWKQLQTQKLATAHRGEIPPPVWRDMELVHQIDSETFLRYQERSFQEVLAEAEQVFQALVAQVESMSEEELSDPHHYPWQEGDEPLRGETMGNGLWHPCHQLSTFYLQSGRRARAVQLQEALLAAVRQANMPAENLGVVIYNQACFYASHGWPEKALQLLPEALQLRPTLIEWSQHDSDLARLRNDPAFQAIFADPRLKAPVSRLISPQELSASSATDAPPLIIDVRGSTEYRTGHLQGAINIPLGQLTHKHSQLPRDRQVVAYCNMHHRGESRGERAAAQLREQGYQAQTLDGGYPGWKEQGFPVDETP
ncbi:MAG: rhodanese-like domain-containing protein [Ktedonobacteraceae bacterium]|nr:rhodanese-like domain-containing protein [Chloroflexota bacterium]